MSVALVSTTPNPSSEWRQALERASAALQAGVILSAPCDDFSPLPGQPRSYFGPESMRRMTESIMGPLGQMFEGLARPDPSGEVGKYQIIDGERRWRGCKKAGKLYRARIITIDDDTLPYILAAVANFNRESLSPPEVVNTIHFLRDLKAPWEEIAQMLGSSVQWIQKIYLLKKLRPEVWDMLDPSRPKSKVLGTMVAVAIAGLHPAQQLAMAERALEHKMTIAAVRHETQKHLKSAQRRAPRKTWRSIANRIGAIERHMADLHTVLSTGDLDEIFRGRTQDQIELLLRQLQSGQDKMQLVRVTLMNRYIVLPDGGNEPAEDTDAST